MQLTTWKGRPLTKLSRRELYALIETLGRQHRDLKRYTPPPRFNAPAPMPAEIGQKRHTPPFNLCRTCQTKVFAPIGAKYCEEHMSSWLK